MLAEEQVDGEEAIGEDELACGERGRLRVEEEGRVKGDEGCGEGSSIEEEGEKRVREEDGEYHKGAPEGDFEGVDEV